MTCPAHTTKYSSTGVRIPRDINPIWRDWALTQRLVRVILTLSQIAGTPHPFSGKISDENAQDLRRAANVITRIERRLGSKIAIFVAMILVAVSPALTNPTYAQNAPTATLVARAVLPAESYADGPSCGAALSAQNKVINGIKLPFPSQPMGSFTAVVPGAYTGTWQFLTSADNIVDCQMRVNLLTIDWRTNGSGGGAASPGEWWTLVDTKNLVPIVTAKNRILTGADFSLAGLVRAADGTFWAGDAHNSLLLHFATSGTSATIQGKVQLANMPQGTLQGLGMSPDGKSFLVASKAGNGLTVQLLQAPNGAPTGTSMTYPLDAPDDNVRGWVMINTTEALVVEQDGGQNEQAQIKRVYLVDLSKATNGGSATKTLLADLLNISDPGNLGTDPTFNAPAGASGLSNPFKFAYQDIGAIYPVDDHTLLLANNNLFPIGTGRVPNKPADTELIQIQVAPLPDLQLKFTQK